MIEDEDILPYIYRGLHDKSPAVRRTAGDCLSDLGFKAALPEMEKALDDPQKLSDGVLLCLYEGNENQLSSLKAHARPCIRS